MAGMRTIVAFLALLPMLALAQDTPVYRVGGHVTAPRVTHKVDPEFSPAAKREHIQGTVMYSLIVGEDGKPHEIEVISPLGYGLDEKGIAAITRWEFAPGMKDGMPVKVKAQVEINFHLGGIAFDAKREERRTSYNGAIHDLRRPEHKRAVETIRKLADEKYLPARALLGDWKVEGKEEIAKDVPGGLELIHKAADKDDGNGLYILGQLTLAGQVVPPDPEKGMKLIREASVNGNQPAQLFLALKYESADGVPADPERARYYFRLCAARGNATCQLHLGQLLTPDAGKAEKGDAVQAAAWLDLAREGSMEQAAELSRALRARMSPEEIQRASKLKPQLIHE